MSAAVWPDTSVLMRAEIGPGYRVELEGEGVGLQASKRVGNVIDGVVGRGLESCGRPGLVAVS